MSRSAAIDSTTGIAREDRTDSRWTGWITVVVASVIMMATLPGRTQGLGLITEPMLRDLQLDRVSYATVNLWATLLGAAICLPIGRLFEMLGSEPRMDRVAIVGLGAGSLTAYGRAGQTMTLYEIDPEVLRTASDPRLFTFLRDSRARLDVVLGDGRLRLARAPAGS